jgi:hypothetical protein
MKKLLLGAAVVLGAIISTKAQTTIYSTNFPSNSIPVGWTQQLAASDPSNLGWQFNSAVQPPGGLLATDYMPPSGDGSFAFINDIDNNPAPPNSKNNNDTLYTAVMNCTTYTHVFLSFDIFYQGYYDNDGTEKATVAISTNGGSTWTTAITNPYGDWTTLTYDISSFVAGHANVKVAFTYNDGGTQLVGMGLDNIKIYSPAPFDVAVLSQNLPFLMQVGHAYNFSGTAADSGSTTITSMQMNYSVNGHAAVSQNITTGSFTSLTTYNWSMNSTSSAFTPAAPGIYTVKYWANNLNGSNPNTCLDTLEATFWAIDTVKTKQSCYEEFTGQSCVYCMLAAPNMDSVYDNNVGYTNIVRYHVPIPARDYMYNTTTAPVNTRESYYSVGGAPDGFMDGTYLNPSAYQSPPAADIYSSVTVQGENTIGSPFKIDITKTYYNATKDSFYVSANITAYAAFSAGLTAQVTLTLDSITYKYDLSMDDPQPTFAPPIGTGAAGSYTDCPDYFYPFLLKYTHVAEEMFPNSGSGTSLAAFTNGQTQTVSFGWKKNHPWGNYDPAPAQRDSDFYDSSATGQFVVFVQTNNAIPADGIPAKYIFQSASAPVNTTHTTPAGIEEIANAVSFEMYPNPTNNSTNIAFNLTKDQNVNLEVYNMLGEKVYSNNQGMIPSGQHIISINASNLQNGIYFVRFTADNVPTTQKLIIQR